jgi:hypothetical protein
MTTLKQTVIELIDDSNYNEAATKFLEATNTKLKIEFLKHGKHFADDKQTRDIYKCKLQRGKNSYSFNFGQSIVGAGTKPTNYDILACLQKYDVGSFEDFCNMFGYDNDSRAAEKTYKAVCKEFEGMERLFSSEELEILSEIN